MLENATLRIGGAITLWNLSEFTDQAGLQERLEILGLREFAPPVRSPVSALKEALQATIGGPRILIRPLEGNDGWVCYEERRGNVENDFKHIVTAKVDENLCISYAPFNQLSDQITDKFNEHRGYVHAADVSGCLVKILGNQMGLSLRPRGAVYWLSESRLPMWFQVGSAIEDTSINRTSCIYLLRNVMDQDANKCVQAALVSEIETAAKEMNDAISTGELGKRALNNRIEQAQNLREKIKEYESILNTTLGSLTSAVDEVELAATKAVLLASGKSDAA
jgi:hypothetical protein